MNFGKALEALQRGERLQRSGWNGKGIFIELQEPDANSKMSSPYIFIDTTGLESDNDDAPRSRVPWLASQTDMLSDDWQVVGDHAGGRVSSLSDKLALECVRGVICSSDLSRRMRQAIAEFYDPIVNLAESSRELNRLSTLPPETIGDVPAWNQERVETLRNVEQSLAAVDKMLESL